MAKRRTRKDKIKAKHKMLIPLNDDGIRHKYASVKGHLASVNLDFGAMPKEIKKADHLVNNTTLTTIKKDLQKSLIVASLILGLELVIYLAI